MRERTQTVYTFDELSDSAKERAADWYRQGIEVDDLSHIADDAVTIAGILGIRIDTKTVRLMNGKTRQEPAIYWETGRSGGATFSGWYEYRKGCSAAIRQHAPTDTDLHSIADDLVRLQRATFYRLQARIGPKQRCYYGVDCTVERADDIEPTAEQIDGITQAIQEFAQWIASAVERELEWIHSDENVRDNILANEYEFDEDGRIIR